MKKIQTKLLILSLACVTCIVFFVALVVHAAFANYISLRNFQATSEVSQAAGVLSLNLTNERQAAYAASTFTGEGTPAQILERFKNAANTSRASLTTVRELAAANDAKFTQAFKDALKVALDAESVLTPLRTEILDPSRPQISEPNTPLKTKALTTYDTALVPQATILPVSCVSTEDGALVRKILTRDNIARIQKDIWKMRGIVASTLRRKKIEGAAPAELAMKMLSEADHVARVRAIADPEIAARLETILKSPEYVQLIAYCSRIRESNRDKIEHINAPDANPAEEALAYQTGPSARLETAYTELATAATETIATYTRARLADARTELIFYSTLALFSITSIIGFIIYIARSITAPLRHVSTELGKTAVNATRSAQHIAGSSGQLSEDSCEQAAALEEISSSMNELSSMNTSNLGHVRKMSELAGRAIHATTLGSQNVEQLSTALDAIQTSTRDVESILKTINEIAFQTNILALNAAVEAARAGEAGAGFAVVADEVRTLAQRSAKAAQDTAAKIEAAVKNSAQGSGLGKQAAVRFEEISALTGEYHTIVKEIEGSAQQSSEGLNQVNEALQKVDQIVQRTAAAAEENASASTEMRAQVDRVYDYIRQLETMIVSEKNLGSQKDAASVDDAPPSAPQAVPSASHRVTDAVTSHA